MDTDQQLQETTLTPATLYQGKIIDLHVDTVTLPDGNTARREYVSHHGGAAILAVDDEGYTYLVRQFRYAYRTAMWEIPAGKLEAGEDALSAAGRELQEEIGYTADTIVPYGVLYPSPGYTNEQLSVFLATNLRYTGTHPDADEFLEIRRFPIRQVLAMIQQGQIHDAKTCYALYRYCHQHNIH